MTPLCLSAFRASPPVAHSRQGSAELLRTYGFVEPSPYTRVAITLDELINTTTRPCATRGRGGRAPLSALRARHRAAALERASLLPAGGIFQVGAAAEVDPALLTAAQVLAMTGAEFDEWAAEGGGIALGPAFLDEEHLPDVAACLLGVVAERLRLLRRPPLSGGEGGAAAEEKAGDGGGGGGGGSAAAKELSQALKREETAVLEALRAAVLRLEPADDDEGEEEEEEEGVEEEGDDDEGDDGEEGKAVGEEGAVGAGQDTEARAARQEEISLVGRKRGRRP